MSELATAIATATILHADQTDKSGQPYIGHPLRVMGYAAIDGASDTMLTAAILHDVIEDTRATLTHLKVIGISDDAIRLVQVLTRDRDDDGLDESYFDYIQRIKAYGDEAILLKLADLTDNLDKRREFDGSKKLRPRYLKARSILEA